MYFKVRLRRLSNGGVDTYELNVPPSKHERILLFWSRSLVGRIRILKYDVLFLVVFVVLIKSRTLA